MATTTARLALRKPATSDLVNVTTDIGDNADKVDAAVGFERLGAFPGSPYSGKPVMRSDLTDNTFVWNGTVWKAAKGNAIFTSTANITAGFPSPVEGDTAIATDNDAIYVYNGGWQLTNFYNTPRARLKNTSTQTTTSAVNAIVNFPAEDLDTWNGHDNVTNNTRYTAGIGGLYLCIATIPWDFSNLGKRELDFRKNGTTIYNGDAFFSGTSVREMSNASRLIDLAAGDYVEVLVNQNSGGNLNIDGTKDDGTRFDIIWMAP